MNQAKQSDPLAKVDITPDVGHKTGHFHSVILAGERPGGKALNQAFNLSASVMVPVAGKPSLSHVMKAVKDSQQVTGGIICGPSAEVVGNSSEIRRLLQDSDHEWLEPASGPAASAISALEKLGRFPVLLTTGDHALLTGEIIDDFCRELNAPELILNESVKPGFSGKTNYDFVIGLVPYALVQADWPESKRTVYKFSNGHFCGSNLLGVLSPKGLRALHFWRRVESERKHPWRIIRHLGYITLMHYLFRRLTLEDAMQSLSAITDCRIGYIPLNFARAAMDVDSIKDQKLAEKYLVEKG